MPVNRLYDTLLEQIMRLRPGEWITRLRNLTWLLVGISLSKSVHLSKIALKIPSPTKGASLTRRLSRFLDNPYVQRLIPPGVPVLLVGGQ